jgi:DNA mismatch endonuclease Vsr
VSAAEIEGKPDFSFERERLAVFLDGCHWHGCPRCYRPPASNAVYWSEKLARNRRRDKLVSAKLRRAGWQVLRIWEHEVRASPVDVISKITRLLGGRA